MTTQYHVRTGVWGELGRYRASDATHYKRGQNVICQTERGLEVGEVVSSAEDNQVAASTILRAMGQEDLLLQERLERYKRKAVEDCRTTLTSRGFDAVLLEVEQLFDGRTLFFHFLGEVSDEVEAVTKELTDVYERNVRSKHFAKLLSEGCGPDCGTKEGSGCSGGCAVCVVASACASKAIET